MKTYEELKNSYIGGYNYYIDEKKRLGRQIERLEKKLKRLEQKQLTGTIKNFWIPLADEIKERCNFKCYAIYGPFGLDSETTIYFANEGQQENIDICNVETWSITFKNGQGHTMEASVNEKGEYNPYTHIVDFNPTYNTGEENNNYQKGSIGYHNGFNNIVASLPESVEEIIKILKHYKKEGKC